MIYIVCKRSIYRYFREYCESLINNSNKKIELKLYDDAKKLNLDKDNKYIFVINAEYDDEIKALDGYDFVVFNGEQTSKKFWNDAIQNIIQKNIPIIDYNLTQSHYDDHIGVKYTHIPYQYERGEYKMLKNLMAINKVKKYDVAICTNNSEKRNNIIQKITEKGYKVIDAIGWGLNNRDTKIAQSKILINIHYQDNYKIFEHIRCDRWIFAGHIVISEKSLKEEELDIKDLVIFEDYDKLSDKVDQVLKNYNKYKQDLEMKSHQLLNKIIMNRKNKFDDYFMREKK